MAGLKDATPLYQDVAEYMTEATRARFLAGTAPDGGAWAPKKASTLERYRRLRNGSRGISMVMIRFGKPAS